MFGRIDLVFDTATRRVKAEKTRAFAGLSMRHGACPPEAQSFCEAAGDGVVTYERLFKVLPFSNKTLVLKPVDRAHLVRLAKDAVVNQGEYGILVPSGLDITYDKAKGELVRVALSDGRLLFSNAPGAALAEGPFKIGTFDFLATQTSGVPGLNDVGVEADLGVFRELIADYLEGKAFVFPTAPDKRIKIL